MSVSVTPHTKFAVASVITDGLYGIGEGVGVLSSTVGIHVDATISLPFEATLAVLAAAARAAKKAQAEAA
jgi:hypothetical protein